ncbi:ABC transporter permease [Marinilabilia rubra]|uniref:Multidrug ABC transporter permease n=1 Tax=Marinilabilia rubra TaxID=2162893 RepID=A0A2U2B3C9_9BACT|nr:ABC transporter permease [Marinilabilia rubra]PWD97573.1 multidrug ABC transporter permease [Marinilabilia rubra]
MKQLWVFIKKESKHIFRDSRTLGVLFLMPLAQILIFGYVISTEIKDARIGVYNKANDYTSHQVTERLISSGYFKVVAYFSNKAEMETSLRRGNIQMAVVFPGDFGNLMQSSDGAPLQLVADASEANTAQMLVNYAQGIVNRYGWEKTGDIDQTTLPIQIDVRMFYNPSLKGVFMSVPGIMAMILILVSAMMTSISITREKEFGSMEVLLISPLKPWQIIVGKVAPYVLLSFVNAATILLVGILIFEVPMNGSWLLLGFINLIYILLSLSLGIFISTVANSQMVAMFISLFALMLPTILLSGFIYPIENMPDPLQWLSLLMPPRWYIQSVKDVMFKGAGFFVVWKELLIMISFLSAFMILSVKNFKIRLE